MPFPFFRNFTAPALELPEKLGGAETLIPAIIEHSPSIIFIKNLEGKYILVNKAFERFAFKTRTQILDHTTAEVFPDYYGDFRLHDLDVIQEKAPRSEEFSALIGGIRQSMQITKFPLFNELGEIEAVCGIGVEITSLKNRERELVDQLEETRRTKTSMERFLAVISHEIRTPLTAVLGLLELIREQNTQQDLEEYLTLVQNSAEGVRVLLNDILDLSKMEAGRFILRPRNFDLVARIRDIVSTYVAQENSNDRTITFVPEPDLPPRVTADPQRIGQVITNLLTNALHWTPSGEITVSIERNSDAERSGDFMVCVTDTGAGIPADMTGKLFRKYCQLRRESAAPDSCGLGLSICKELVDVMGGSIWVESPSHGGARFCFTFNAEPVNRETQDRDPHFSPSPPLTVLVAENDPLLQHFLRYVLNKAGHSVLTACCGEEVLSLLTGNAPDIILMDIELDGLDGLETCRRIRSGEPEGVDVGIPILALTGHGSEDQRARFLAAGMSDCLIKPMDAETLVQSVERIAQPVRTV